MSNNGGMRKRKGVLTRWFGDRQTDDKAKEKLAALKHEAHDLFPKAEVVQSDHH